MFVCAGVATAPTPARADTASDEPATARARTLYAEGAQAYKSGDYKRAVRAFREADQLKPGSLDLLRVLGLAEVRAEGYAEGANHLSAWLRRAPAEGDEKKSAEELLEAAEARVGRLEIKSDPAAEIVEVDAVRIAEPSAPVYVNPGEHLVVASLGLRRATRRTTLGAGQVVSVQLSLLPAFVGAAPAAGAPAQQADPALQADHSPRAAPPARVEQKPPPAAYARAIVLGLGAGITVGGLALGTHGLASHLAANGRVDDLSALLQSRNQSCSPPTNASASLCRQHASNQQDADSAKTLAIVGFGVAGIAGLATAAGILWWPEWTPTPRAVTLSVQPVPGGLTVLGKF